MPLPIALIMIVAGALITRDGWRRLTCPGDWEMADVADWIFTIGMALLLGGVIQGTDRVLNGKPKVHVSAQQEYAQHSPPAVKVPCAPTTD